MSIDYYVRLERGKETHPSPSVVEALRLNEEERGFLRELATRAARRAPEPRPLPSQRVRPTVTQLLETLRLNPAYVVSRTDDLLAANPGGLRLLHGIADWPERQRNTVRYTFLHPAAHVTVGGVQAARWGC
ncbi:MmyB family transcriptional regulator [Streptosporangium sp. NPDC002607]